MPARDLLAAIFSADQQLRKAETSLLGGGLTPELKETLQHAIEEAEALPDEAEAGARLTRLADLCAQLEGPEMVDALIRILDNEDPAVRVAAGDALLDVGYERYAEVARGVERALGGTVKGPALLELPFVLAEIGEPSALGLIRRFLKHPAPDVIAAAIEALAHLRDPAGADALRPLLDDERVVALDTDDEEAGSATLGELAREALDTLEG